MCLSTHAGLGLGGGYGRLDNGLEYRSALGGVVHGETVIIGNILNIL